MNGYCVVCGNDIEVTMCCSDIECGCMGQPVEPPICSGECYDELMNNIEKYYPKHMERIIEFKKETNTDK